MTLRQTARAQVAAYAPADPGQAALREELLAALDEREDACLRSSRPDHLTASACVLDPGAERVLLVLHGKVGRWLQPGGHCEPGDADLAAAALREAREETGVADLAVVGGLLDLDAHPAPCRPGTGDRHLDTRWLVLAPADARPVPDAESRDARWWHVEDVLGGRLPEADDSVTRLVAAARARVRG